MKLLQENSNRTVKELAALVNLSATPVFCHTCQSVFAFTTQLATHGISANVIAAYRHDHIFVPTHQVVKATEVLNELKKE